MIYPLLQSESYYFSMSKQQFTTDYDDTLERLRHNASRKLYDGVKTVQLIGDGYA